MKKIASLGEFHVIHCPTLEEAIAICNLMASEGLEWFSNDSYLDNNNWLPYGKNTCYCPNYNASKRGTFCYLEFYKDKGHTIHQASEFLPENFY
jgi:hypothetical protein